MTILGEYAQFEPFMPRIQGSRRELLGMMPLLNSYHVS